MKKERCTKIKQYILYIYLTKLTFDKTHRPLIAYLEGKLNKPHWSKCKGPGLVELLGPGGCGNRG